MREWLIIIIALIAAGFIVYFFNQFRYRKYPDENNRQVDQSNGQVWAKICAFFFPLLGFIIALWFELGKHNKAEAKSCVLWAFAGMLLNAISYLFLL
ncbi:MULTISPECIES: hypothetical protein [Lactobacillus]|uniref:Uncharacterized protein n=1 Tax=Lactobacillus xujianguonis TaxID=2495899 RepID=A0A437SXQ7_9LACO|nr:MULTISPECIES: hypothetical protein [Lactobacillus]RVU71597.1 hypothetical protein EJK17_01080 [Lactobacillus xujianguonis]RVU77752.1 hypothetical protein EJK20_00630 [Lactobacillus xujianguonis]